MPQKFTNVIMESIVFFYITCRSQETHSQETFNLVEQVKSLIDTLKSVLNQLPEGVIIEGEEEGKVKLVYSNEKA